MSLGYRRGNDHIAERTAAPKPIALRVEDPPCAAPSKLSCTTMHTTKGFLPTLTFAAAAALVPLLLHYMEYDFADNAVRGTAIGLSATTALAMVVANDCAVWYNMALFFHTGLEATIVDLTFTYAYEDGRAEEFMALALTGGVVVIVHLIPFFLSNNACLLTLLAMAGLVVNTAIVVFLEPSLLLLAGASSAALLGITLVVIATQCVEASMLSLLRKAINEGSWLTCSPCA